MISTSPVATTSSPKLDKRLPTFLTLEEIERLLKAPDLSTPQGQRDRALLELLYASGPRVSELAQLTLERVNLDTRETRVWGKGAKERVVLMGKPAAEALTTYLSQGRPRLLGKKKSRFKSSPGTSRSRWPIFHPDLYSCNQKSGEKGVSLRSSHGTREE